MVDTFELFLACQIADHNIAFEREACFTSRTVHPLGAVLPLPDDRDGAQAKEQPERNVWRVVRLSLFQMSSAAPRAVLLLPVFCLWMPSRPSRRNAVYAAMTTHHKDVPPPPLASRPAYACAFGFVQRYLSRHCSVFPSTSDLES
jgi:hypothetical protein